jgi:oligopeptide/dipeptide ABC transporter ATP-binding protein
MNKKDPILSVKNLETIFSSSRAWWFGNQQHIKAVNDVSLDIYRNEVVGLVGESGSGKTTLGRSILKLVKSNSGEIVFNGKNILTMKNKDLKNLYRNVQLIFQDPYGSLSPRMQIGKIIAEPLKLHNMVSENRIESTVTDLLKEVGLESYFKDRYPHEMSGGQRQRIAIARVLALQPQIIIADEAVSSLDVSVTAQILNLLKMIQKKNQMSMLFISHDLKVISHIADRIMVMYAGQIVEKATTKELLENPLHPYTKLLIASIPGNKNRNKLKKTYENTNNEGSYIKSFGCPFVDRCPESETKCNESNPVLKESKSDRYVACHYN